MNVFENIPTESEFRVDMTRSMSDYLIGCGDNSNEVADGLAATELAIKMTVTAEDGELSIDQDTPIGQLLGDGEETDDCQGWPGDGSGLDDLADYNANEAADYSNE
jgi:hypothetical protein